MNIIILGDSWGVPNYDGPPGVAPEYHTEFLLKKLNFNVFNFAKNGGSNIESLIKAENFLKNNNKIKIDWILWFHTESLREKNLINYDKPFYIDTLIEKLSKNIYKEYEKFRLKIQAKLFAIGGQAQILDCFDDICNADYVIKDWKSEILNVKLPIVHTLKHLNLIDQSRDDEKYKSDLLFNHLTILDEMKNSKDFPDNCHPGIKPHKELVEKFLKIIK